MSYIRIKWSGYWDFPTGVYPQGSKNGQNISGEFDQKYIMLENVSPISYEIDPGKINIPKSPSFSFTLINRNPNTGSELFSKEMITSLGRTKEYGGTIKSFGDLFIEVISPILGNKVIFKGVLDSFEYSNYKDEVKLNCVDFTEGVLKSQDFSILSKFKMPPLEVYDIENNTSNVLDEFGYTGKSIKSLNDIDIELSRMSLKPSEDSAYINDALKYSFKIDIDPITYNTPLIPLPADFYDYIKDEINSDLIAGNINGVYKERNYSDDVSQGMHDLFVKYKMFDNIYKNNQDWNHPAFISDDNNPITAFIKIDESTILTQLKYRVNAYFLGGSSSATEYILNGFLISFEFDVIHLNNGNYISWSSGSEPVTVYEKGRFRKKEEDYSVGDSAQIYIIDWIKNNGITNEDYSKSIVEDFHFKSNELPDFDINNSNFIGGISFKEKQGDSSVLVPNNEVYFNNVKGIINAINENLLNKYIKGTSYNLIKDFEDENEFSQYSFVSDLIHYGWVNENIIDIITGSGMQISAYIHATEDGYIKYSHRSIYDIFFNSGFNLGNFVKLYKEFYKIDKGNSYNYGSKNYKIEFKDLIELNNLESSESFERELNSDGIVVNSISKPKDLKISNYRTTDAGVPPSIEDTPPDYPVLRYSPISENIGINKNKFINLYLDQAKKTISSLRYPSEMFTVSIDFLFNSSLNYESISVGDIIIDGDEYDESGSILLYLVKKIIYDVNKIYSESTSLTVDLFYLGEFSIGEISEFININISDSLTESKGALTPVAASASTTIISGSDYNGDYTIIYEKPEPESGWYSVSVYLDSGEEPYDIALKIYNEIKATSFESFPLDIEITAQAQMTFTESRPGYEYNDLRILFPDYTGTGVLVSDDEIEMSGGKY